MFVLFLCEILRKGICYLQFYGNLHRDKMIYPSTMTTIKPNKTPIVFNTFFAIFMTFYSFILSLFIRYLVIVFIITYKSVLGTLIHPIYQIYFVCKEHFTILNLMLRLIGCHIHAIEFLMKSLKYLIWLIKSSSLDFFFFIKSR